MRHGVKVSLLALGIASLFVAGACASAGGRARLQGRTLVNVEESRTLVYLIDGSASTMRLMGTVKRELKRSVAELGEGDQFQIIFYGASTTEIPGPEPAPATGTNKEAAWRLIDEYLPTGDEGPPEAAFVRAFACRPTIIYFLPGGRVSPDLIERVNRLNVGKRTSVCTIRVLERRGDEDVLGKVAADNWGNYRFVTEDYLDEYVREPR
jgi:hypothetical protein